MTLPRGPRGRLKREIATLEWCVIHTISIGARAPRRWRWYRQCVMSPVRCTTHVANVVRSSLWLRGLLGLPRALRRGRVAYRWLGSCLGRRVKYGSCLFTRFLRSWRHGLQPGQRHLNILDQCLHVAAIDFQSFRRLFAGPCRSHRDVIHQAGHLLAPQSLAIPYLAHWSIK